MRKAQNTLGRRAASQQALVRGISEGRPSRASRGLVAQTTPVAEPNVASREPAPDSVPDNSNQKYAEAAKAVVHVLQTANAEYGNQTETVTKGGISWEERKQDFLVDDSAADCSKLVLKSLLNADNIQYGGNWQALTVPAFGGAQLKDLTSVNGMRSRIQNLAQQGRASAIRPADPRIGDIVFWGGHVAIVTNVEITDVDVLIDFAGMGRKSRAKVHTKIAVEGQLRNDKKYGSGGFEGFWTPLTD